MYYENNQNITMNIKIKSHKIKDPNFRKKLEKIIIKFGVVTKEKYQLQNLIPD